LLAGFVSVVATLPAPASADVVTVRQTEGQLHGFLVLRNPDGEIIANGELSQSNRGSQVTSKLVYRFKDGSSQEETTIFSQSGHFRLQSYRQIQKGPIFKMPMSDLSIDGRTGVVTVHYQDEKGNAKVETEHMELPPDLANGMVPILLKNLAADAQTANWAMVVATPKPLLVHLAVTLVGEHSFSTGSASHKAIWYNVKVEIGGVKGVIAPIVGKQPPDTRVWIFGGASPAFVKSEGPMFQDGPIWRTELVSPAWPKADYSSADRKK